MLSVDTDAALHFLKALDAEGWNPGYKKAVKPKEV